MNERRFPKGWKPAAAVAVTAAFFTPLLMFGGTAFARTGAAASEYEYSSHHQYRVGICHRTHSKKHPTHTIWVARAAVKAHLRHGDELGACTGTEQVRGKHSHGAKHQDSSGDDGQQTTQEGNGQQHGSGGEHGKGGGHGK
jgi:hypothetical protein